MSKTGDTPDRRIGFWLPPGPGLYLYRHGVAHGEEYLSAPELLARDTRHAATVSWMIRPAEDGTLPADARSIAWLARSEISGEENRRQASLGRITRIGEPDTRLLRCFRRLSPQLDAVLAHAFSRCLSPQTQTVVARADPDFPGLIVMTCTGGDKAGGGPERFCVVEAGHAEQDGAPGIRFWSPDGRPPSSSYPALQALLARRGRAETIVHTHSLVARAFSDVPPGCVAVSGDPRGGAFGAVLADALATGPIAWRQGEGVWACGPGQTAVDRIARFERACLTGWQAARARALARTADGTEARYQPEPV